MTSCRLLARVSARLRLLDIGTVTAAPLHSILAGVEVAAAAPLSTAASIGSTLSEQFRDSAPTELRQTQPYRRSRRPKPWPEIQLGIQLNAARNRPANTNRKNFDRQIARQIQIAKDAWKRKENKWKNEQANRAEAEKRWALRRAVVKAESEGQYLFESEYDRQVQKRLKRAQYRPPTKVNQRTVKRK